MTSLYKCKHCEFMAKDFFWLGRHSRNEHKNLLNVQAAITAGSLSSIQTSASIRREELYEYKQKLFSSYLFKGDKP